MENMSAHFLSSEEGHISCPIPEIPELKEEQDWHLENTNNECNIPETNNSIETSQSEMQAENPIFDNGYVDKSSETPNNEEIAEVKHEASGPGEMSLSCTECDFTSYSNEIIEIHMSMHTNYLFLSEECPYRRRFNFIVSKHPIILKYIDDVHDTYYCTQCNYKSVSKFSTLVHLCGKHTPETVYACEPCEFLGYSNPQLDDHYNTHPIHIPEKPTYECSICGLKVHNKGALTVHINTHSEKKKLACTMCGYTTNIKGSLKTHMLIHSETSEILKCTECDYSTVRKNALRTHMVKHTGKYPFICAVCGYKCLEKRNMDTHKMRHTGEKPFNCSLCEFKCRSKSRLANHMKNHDKNHQCQVCKKFFASAKSVEFHMAKHTGIKPYKCEQCDFSTARKLYMKRHMLYKHSASKPFLCTECGHSCATEADLKRHVFSHTGERPYACTLCDYTGTTEQNLKSHMFTHKTVKSIACSECDYTCSASKSLIAHMATHTGVKAFSCSICDKRFTRKVLRNKHMLIHTGEKPYKCSYCGYQCRTSDRLKSHERTHTGEKPFNCSLCGYRCNDSGNFSKHMRLKHKGNKPEPTKKPFVPPKRLKDSLDNNLVTKLLVNTQDLVNNQEQYLLNQINSHSNNQVGREELQKRPSTNLLSQIQTNNYNVTRETNNVKECDITDIRPAPKQTLNTNEVPIPDNEIMQSVAKLIGKASPKVQKILKNAASSIESLGSGGSPSNLETKYNHMKYQNEILQCVNLENKKISENLKSGAVTITHKEPDPQLASSSLVDKKSAYRTVDALVTKSTHFMAQESQSPLYANGVSYKTIEDSKPSFSLNHSPSGTQLPSQYRSPHPMSHTTENSNSTLYTQTPFNSPYFNSLFHSQHLNSAMNRNINQNLFYPNSPHYNPAIYNHETNFTNQSEQLQ